MEDGNEGFENASKYYKDVDANILILLYSISYFLLGIAFGSHNLRVWIPIVIVAAIFGITAIIMHPKYTESLRCKRILLTKLTLLYIEAIRLLKENNIDCTVFDSELEIRVKEKGE